jgi:hypothetical protein
MSRAGMQGAGGPMGSPAGNEELPTSRRWLFPAVAGGLTALWLFMNLPYTEPQGDEPMTYTTKRGGWPSIYARWSVENDTGKTTYSSFFTSGLLVNLVVLAAPIVVAGVIIRHLNRHTAQTSDQAAVRPRGTTGRTP